MMLEYQAGPIFNNHDTNDDRMTPLYRILMVMALLLVIFTASARPWNALDAEKDVNLTYPRALWLGDDGVIDLRLSAQELIAIAPAVNHGQTAVTDLFETQRVVVEARLQLVGMDYAPTGSSLEPLAPGSQVRFNWRVNANRPGNGNGTVWVHLRLVPKNGGEELRLPVYAFPVSIAVKDWFGIDTGSIRLVLLSVVLVALVLLVIEIKQRMGAAGKA
ncbi:MAG: hypothetical protein HPY76_04290 [Anaerolineae bacterium]|nr:hypothetical protein [Anaerolineae bacterium]